MEGLLMSYFKRFITIGALLSISVLSMAQTQLSFSSGTFKAPKSLPEIDPVEFNRYAISQSFGDEDFKVDLKVIAKKSADGDSSIDYSGLIKYKYLQSYYSKSDFLYELDSSNTVILESDLGSFSNWDGVPVSSNLSTKTLTHENFRLILDLPHDPNARQSGWSTLLNAFRPFIGYKKTSGTSPLVLNYDEYTAVALELPFEKIYENAEVSGFSLGLYADSYRAYNVGANGSTGWYFDFNYFTEVSFMTLDSIDNQAVYQNHLNDVSGYQLQLNSDQFQTVKQDIKAGLGYIFNLGYDLKPRASFGVGYEYGNTSYETKSLGKDVVQASYENAVDSFQYVYFDLVFEL